MTITDQEYRILDLFVGGAEAPAIADGLGLRTIVVSGALNRLTKRSRSVARDLLNERPAPPPVSPLTAPIVVKPKPKPPVQDLEAEMAELLARPKPAPALTTVVRSALVREAVASTRLDGETIAIPGPVTVGPTPAKETDAVPLPFPVHLDDLDTTDQVMTVAVNHEAASIRNKAAVVSEQFAALRQEIIRLRRNEARSAARARIAELEAELSQLRELVGAA